jgi:hypothetical protein
MAPSSQFAWHTHSMSERTRTQLDLIRRVVAVTRAAGMSAWLFGGWGLDARIGHVTRDHGDVEFWVERRQGRRLKDLLVAAGADSLTTQPPEESCEFLWDGAQFSTAYFDRRSDGAITLKGRWSDWELPRESFGDDLASLDGLTVLAMSLTGMLAMKQQFPTLRNGEPWRLKDREDIATLQALIVQAASQRTM